MKRANPGSLIAVLTIVLMTGVVPRCAGNVPVQVAADRKFFGVAREGADNSARGI